MCISVGLCSAFGREINKVANKVAATLIEVAATLFATLIVLGENKVAKKVAATL